MTLYLEFEDDVKLDIESRRLAEKAIDIALDYIKCPYEVEINMIITSNSEIQVINNEQRGIDKATDVLSFPMIEYEIAGDFSCVEDGIDYFHPDTGELILGDIIISAEKVKEQAENFGHSHEREFTFLIAHSMLHLFGYDHMEEDERIEMESMQAEIMNQLGISRD